MRSLLTLFFGIAILGAHLHCVLEHGHPAQTRLTQSTQFDNSAPMPPQGLPLHSAPTEGDDHPGCICQGATLCVHFHLFDNSGQNSLDLLPVLCTFSSPAITTANYCDIPYQRRTEKPLSALELCAHLQTFQL
jgi:hypothetical protein